MTSIPWRRWSRRVVPAMALVLALLAGGAYAMAESEASTLAMERVALAGIKDRLERARISEPQPTPAPQRAILQPAPDTTGALRELESFGVAAGVRMAGVQALATTAPGCQSFNLVGSATPESLCNLLAAIEGSARLMVVEQGTITAARDEQVDFEVRLSTFHRLEAGR